jgi:hypothetical protein
LPLAGSIAETYLRTRGIDELFDCGALRFHPRCYSRGDDGQPSRRRRALIAIVTDLNGATAGVHRTYLADNGAAKAPISTPRRSLGAILGQGVRFGSAVDVLAAGEGIETTLSLSAPCRPCPWSLRCHLRTSRRLFSRAQSSGSTSPATPTKRATVRGPSFASGRAVTALRRSR